MKNNFLTAFLLLITLNACETDDQVIPNTYVNFAIYLDQPQFIDLNAVGGAVYVTGGVRGIIIYRKSFSEFVAVDRACPNNPYDERVILDETRTMAIDTVCGSQFSLSLNGAVIHGPASIPLKAYSARYNQISNGVFITN